MIIQHLRMCKVPEAETREKERERCCHQEEEEGGGLGWGQNDSPEQATEMVAEETISPPSAPYFSTYSHQFCEEALGSLPRLGKLPL